VTDQTDWARVHALTDTDIAKAVEDDPDTFVPDAAWMAQAQLVPPRGKKLVTLRVDPDVLNWFRQGGRGYQSRMHDVLKAFVASKEA